MVPQMWTIWWYACQDLSSFPGLLHTSNSLSNLGGFIMVCLLMWNMDDVTWFGPKFVCLFINPLCGQESVVTLNLQKFKKTFVNCNVSYFVTFVILSSLNWVISDFYNSSWTSCFGGIFTVRILQDSSFPYLILCIFVHSYQPCRIFCCN